MWHPIAFVAESLRLDGQALTEFAIENEDKYGILIEGRGPEVNTWHVDALVSDFRTAIENENIKSQQKPMQSAHRPRQ
jgi:hypothetical protein